MTTDAKFEDGKLIVTRVYDAPRELVFEAWVETSKVQQWWGCDQCTSVRSEIEPKIGGQYNHHMTIDGAGEMPGFAKLIEFDPPSRLAYESPSPDGSDAKMVVSVDFSDVDEGTLVRLEHVGIPEIRVEGDFELRAIVQAGWTAAFRKLGGFLESEANKA